MTAPAMTALVDDVRRVLHFGPFGVQDIIYLLRRPPAAAVRPSRIRVRHALSLLVASGVAAKVLRENGEHMWWLSKNSAGLGLTASTVHGVAKRFARGAGGGWQEVAE